MNYRHVNLQSNIDITTAGSRTYDLKIRDVISRLMFKFNVTAYETEEAMADHPTDTVTKIELMDGSNVISALSGPQMIATNYYDRKKVPFSYINQVTNTDSYFGIDFDFGRWLYDEELAFDPTKFDNPQIKITYDKAQMAANAAHMYMTIMAECFDQKAPTPIGFLSREQVTTWTPETDETAYHTIPVDLTIRKLFMRGYATDDHVRDQIHDFKLTEDHDKHVIMDTDTRSYMSSQWTDYPPITEPLIFCDNTTGVNHFVLPSYDVMYVGLPSAAKDLYRAEYAGNRVLVNVETATGRTDGWTRGMIPLHTLCIPFGKQDVIEDWFDVIDVKDLELQTKAGTVATTPLGYIWIENLRRY